jgi:hypothetical protein
MGFKLRPGISAGNVTLTPGTNENFTGPEDHQATAQVSVGQQQFISPGWQTWTVPNGVTSISAVLIAGGGGGGGNNGASGPGSSGGGGGGLRWINNLPVTPGEVLNIQVGSGGNAGTSYSNGSNGGSSAIQRGTDTLVYAGGGYAGKSNVSTGVLGGSGGTGSSIGGNIGGGNGGAGGPATTNSAGSGGGGAGGYSGNGGLGEGNGVSSTNGSGGGGAGARRINSAAADYTTGGGGVGFFGEGSSGQTGVPAGAGSGGYIATNSRAGNYGGGGGGTEDDTNAPGLAGGQGAVRIIWPGHLREFPNTDTNDLDEIDGYSLSDSPNSVGPPVTNDAELHLNAYGSVIADGSRNSHSPTIVGYVPSNDDSPYEFGYSMEFGGTDNYITISNNNLNANWNDDFTLEAWVYATESSGDNIAFGEWGVGTRSFAVGILNGNFYFKYGASATVQTGSSVTLGQWYHLALTNVGGTKNLYVDGILDTSATADFVSTTHDFSIGASSYGGDQFNGRISDVRYTGSVVYEDDFVVPSERLRGYNISVAAAIPNPSISGFNTSYSLVQGEDLVVSGSVVDLPGDSFTWSFEELIGQSNYLVATDYDYTDSGKHGATMLYDTNDLSAEPTVLLGSTNPDDDWGTSVYMNSKYIVVGTFREDSNKGAVYVYNLSDLSAAPRRISKGGRYEFDQFGRNVFVDDDTVYVASNINGTSSKGVVYAYDDNAISTKIPSYQFSPSGGENTDLFGYSFAANDTHLFISAPFHDESGLTNSGRVYVYDKNDLTNPTVLVDPNPTEYGYFGMGITATNNRLIILSAGFDSSRGKYFVYDTSDLSTPINELTPNTGANTNPVGSSMDPIIVGDKLFIAAMQYTISDIPEVTGDYHGVVWVYDMNDLSVSPTRMTKPTNLYPIHDRDGFGNSISYDGNKVHIFSVERKTNFNFSTPVFYSYDPTDLSSAPIETRMDGVTNKFGLSASAVEFFNSGTDPLISSPYQPYASQGITVSQSDNLLTVSPGTEDATFQLNITATNSVGDSVSQLVDFTFVVPPPPADVSWDSTSSTYGLLNSSSEVTMHSNLHSNTNNTFSQLWSEVDTGIYGIQKDGGISGLDDGLPSGTGDGYVFDDLIQFTFHGNPYTKGTTVKFWNNDLYMTHALSGGWAYFMNFRGVDDNSSYGNFFAWASGTPNAWYMGKGNNWESLNRGNVGSGITGTYDSALNNGWRQHKIQFSSTGYQWYVDDVLTYTSNYVSPGNEMRFNIIAGTGSGSATINRVKLHSLEIFVDGES